MKTFFLFIALFQHGICNPYNSQRPCPDLSIGCIQNYFSRNSNCQPIQYYNNNYQLISTVTVNNAVVIPAPTLNNSFIYQGATIKGTITVNDFYIDPRTANLVLILSVTPFNFNASGLQIYYHRQGQGPLVDSGYGTISINGAVITATFTNSNHLKAQNAIVSAYFSDPNPGYSVAPTISNDPLTRNMFQNIINNIDTLIDSILYAFAPYVLEFFINQNVCSTHMAYMMRPPF